MAERDPKSGKFVKGKSGNPGGRPKGLSIIALIDAAVSEADWRNIISILKTKASRGDLKALEMLMDRRFGKATQMIAGDGGGPVVLHVIYDVKTNA
ncbi:MAG: DUF5681 domain-containing protein [Saccharofermentanales bacterium]